MERLNGVTNISSLKDGSGLTYLAFRKKLRPAFHIVWTDMMLCFLMMFLPNLFFVKTIDYSVIANIFIPLCALWSAYWIHAYICFFHEAAHFNIHSNRMKNDLLSNIVLTPFVGIIVKSYRVSHWEHHKHLGTVKDTEISYLTALSVTNLLQVVTGIYHVKVILKYIQNFRSVGTRAQKDSRAKIFLLTLAVAVVVQLTLSYFMFIYISAAAGLSWLIAYFVLYPLLAKIRQTLEHRSLVAQDSVTDKECQAVNRIFGKDFFSRYFGAAGFNRHLYHHYDPSISYTNFNEFEKFLEASPVSEEISSKRTTYSETFRRLLES